MKRVSFQRSNSERQERPKRMLREDSAPKWREGAEGAAGPTGNGKALMEGQRSSGKGCYHHTSEKEQEDN